MDFIFFNIDCGLKVKTNAFCFTESQKIKRHALGIYEYDILPIESAIEVMKKLEASGQMYILEEQLTDQFKLVDITNIAGKKVEISIYDYLMYRGVDLNYAYFKNRLVNESVMLLLDRVYVEFVKTRYKVLNHLWNTNKNNKTVYIPSRKVGADKLGFNDPKDITRILDKEKYMFIEVGSYHYYCGIMKYCNKDNITYTPGYHAQDIGRVLFTKKVNQEIRMTSKKAAIEAKLVYENYVNYHRIINKYANILVLNIKKMYPEAMLWNVYDMTEFIFLIPKSSITNRIKQETLDIVRAAQENFKIANYIVIQKMTDNKGTMYPSQSYVVEAVEKSGGELIFIE